MLWSCGVFTPPHKSSDFSSDLFFSFGRVKTRSLNARFWSRDSEQGFAAEEGEILLNSNSFFIFPPCSIAITYTFTFHKLNSVSSFIVLGSSWEPNPCGSVFRPYSFVEIVHPCRVGREIFTCIVIGFGPSAS